MLRGWLFSKGGQCLAPQRGLQEEGWGWGLWCPLHRSREHGHVQMSVGADGSHVCGRCEGEDERWRGRRCEEGGRGE